MTTLDEKINSLPEERQKKILERTNQHLRNLDKKPLSTYEQEMQNPSLRDKFIKSLEDEDQEELESLLRILLDTPANLQTIKHAFYDAMTGEVPTAEISFLNLKDK